jgi:hypothetical protein
MDSPIFDAHAHLDAGRPTGQFDGCGFVLAQAMSLAERAAAWHRTDATVAWGVRGSRLTKISKPA